MSEPVPSVVKSGVALAKELNITGTPTVLVNDWLVTPADPNFIIESIRAVAEGKVPKP
jgi:protein-disulfide isomerase